MRGRTARGVAMLGFAAVLFGAGALGLVRTPPEAGDGSAAAPLSAATADGVTALQARLQRVPADYRAWASLGLAYVDQARVTGDPSYYPKADGALARSLSINTDDNDGAAAGMSALAAARHDFASAEDWARRGLAVNPSSAVLYGALNDALTQLGRYPEAFEAAQRMVDLRPDTASLARASYMWELRGDLDQARDLMDRALASAASAADRAFVREQLGELSFNAGDPANALVHHEAGIAAKGPAVALLAGRARAQAALGRTDAALADYAEVVRRAPHPAYLIQFGKLLESLGRTDEAREQYQAVEVSSRLLAANGVALDVEPTLFAADHGVPAEALQAAEAGISTRGLLDMADAYAWALHVNGRHAEALEWSDRALALGSRNALFHYHAGMIRLALGQQKAARSHLTTALSINPYFDPLASPVAAGALARLEVTS